MGGGLSVVSRSAEIDPSISPLSLWTLSLPLIPTGGICCGARVAGPKLTPSRNVRLNDMFVNDPYTSPLKPILRAGGP